MRKELEGRLWKCRGQMGMWASSFQDRSVWVPTQPRRLIAQCHISKLYSNLDAWFKAMHMLIMSVQINKSSICTVTRQHNLFEKKNPRVLMIYLFTVTVTEIQMLSLAQRKSSAGLTAAQQTEGDCNRGLHGYKTQSFSTPPDHIRVFKRRNQTNGKDFLSLKPWRCELETATRSAHTFNTHLSNPCWVSLIDLNSLNLSQIVCNSYP